MKVIYHAKYFLRPNDIETGKSEAQLTPRDEKYVSLVAVRKKKRTED